MAKQLHTDSPVFASAGRLCPHCSILATHLVPRTTHVQIGRRLRTHEERILLASCRDEGDPYDGSETLMLTVTMTQTQKTRLRSQDAGVRKGNGDGTVPLVSLGLHCRKAWRTKGPLNPAGFSVVTHELKHDAVPMYQDPRRAKPCPTLRAETAMLCADKSGQSSDVVSARHARRSAVQGARTPRVASLHDCMAIKLVTDVGSC